MRTSLLLSALAVSLSFAACGTDDPDPMGTKKDSGVDTDSGSNTDTGTSNNDGGTNNDSGTNNDTGVNTDGGQPGACNPVTGADCVGQDNFCVLQPMQDQGMCRMLINPVAHEAMWLRVQLGLPRRDPLRLLRSRRSARAGLRPAQQHVLGDPELRDHRGRRHHRLRAPRHRGAQHDLRPSDRRLLARRAVRGPRHGRELSRAVQPHDARVHHRDLSVRDDHARRRDHAPVRPLPAAVKRGLSAWALALILACEASAPPNYPVQYPRPEGGQVAGETLIYAESPAVIAERLLAGLAKNGWTISFDGGADPTAGRIIGATKDGRSVIASVGAHEGGAVLVVREAAKKN
jgi:hypothetical protein